MTGAAPGLPSARVTGCGGASPITMPPASGTPYPFGPAGGQLAPYMRAPPRMTFFPATIEAGQGMGVRQ
jgi:hypothetical protein